MRPYEVMVIFDADLEEETIRSAVEQSLALIESKGATRGPVDWWGKRRLAYEVDKQRWVELKTTGVRTKEVTR